VAVSGRGQWQALGIVLIRFAPIVLVLALTRLAPERIRHVADLIFYGGLLIGTGCFLVASRKPARSERREAFRRPAQIMALGFFLLAAFALVMLTLVRPNSTPPAWTQVLQLALFAGAFFFIWRGNRKYSKAADAYPGKHANPDSSPGSRGLRRQRLYLRDDRDGTQGGSNPKAQLLQGFPGPSPPLRRPGCLAVPQAKIRLIVANQAGAPSSWYLV